MHNGRKPPYKSSYVFVPIAKKKSYENTGAKYNGYIDLQLTLCTDAHIGSGYTSFDKNGKLLKYEVIKYNDKSIIPGSSFKGVVRQIAEIASGSCDPYNRCNIKKEKLCIVCNTFGTMGWASRVIFPDFLSDNAQTKVVELNKQFPAKKTEPNHYKLYKTGKNNYKMPDRIRVEVITENSSFSGRIYFKELSEEQLALLMFSLGLNDYKNETINLKIGGYKNEGLGETFVKATAFKCNGLDKTPEQLAGDYMNMPSANKPAIRKINDILSSLNE